MEKQAQEPLDKSLGRLTPGHNQAKEI